MMLTLADDGNAAAILQFNLKATANNMVTSADSVQVTVLDADRPVRLHCVSVYTPFCATCRRTLLSLLRSRPAPNKFVGGGIVPP